MFNRPECMLLHGWGTSNSIWQDFAKSSNSFSKISMPCLYETANKASDDKFESMAHVLSDNIKTDTIIVAWSISGLVATPLVRLTNKIKAIVYIASTPCFVNKKGWPNVIESNGIDDLKKRLLKNTPGGLEYFAGLIAHGDDSEKTTNKSIRNNLADEKYKEILLSWLTQMQNVDQLNEFAELSLPLRIILGENDSLINSKIDNQLKQLNSNACCAVVKSCGHAPFLSKQEETIKLVNEFINAKYN
jgi:pimeloyl-ACP methyl ester carboxylesterase